MPPVGKRGGSLRDCCPSVTLESPAKPPWPSLELNSIDNAARKFLISATIVLQKSIHLTAFLDCGAEGSFMSEKFARQHFLRLEPLDPPFAVRLADGSAAKGGTINHTTVPLCLAINHHVEEIRFFIVPSLSHGVILGMDWLRRHNPSIDWATDSVRFLSEYCLSSCFEAREGRKPKEKEESFNLSPALGGSANLTVGPGSLPLNCVVGQLCAIPKETVRKNIQPSYPEVSILTISRETLDEQREEGDEWGLVFFQKNEKLLELRDLASLHSQVMPLIEPLPNANDQSDAAKEIIQEFADVFSKSNADCLPEHSQYDCTIPIQPGSSPPYGRVYNLTPQEKEAMLQYLEENLSKGFIRKSTSPAGAPCFFVKKKDGSLRLCVDFRGLNEITVKNRYPLPLISELIRTVKDAKVFSALDLRGAYNLVRIAEGEEWKTAFRTPSGLFEYLVMPFGLANAPAVFQSMVDAIFSEFKDRFVVCYLDDILVFSQNHDQHREHLRIVLERLRANNLFCKEEKCHFFTDKLLYLGYVISPQGVSMDPSKVESITNWPAPTSRREVQVFLGFANFYRKFIRHFAKTVRPLTRLLRKDADFFWDQATATAFKRIKLAFAAPSFLAHADNSRPFIVETDASGHAIGAILSQEQTNGDVQPVAFYSRQMITAERNYSIFDKELLAVVEAFREWRHYLQGAYQPTQVLTDHRNLEYFTSTKFLTRRLARWADFLIDFDFILRYRPGASNTQADILSREGTSRNEQANQEHVESAILSPKEIILAAIDFTGDSSFLEEIRTATTKDPIVKELPKKGYALKEGLLLYNDLIYVPTVDLRLHILRENHDSPTAGHFGINKTIELVTRNYWWPGLKSFIADYIKSCDCNRAKSSRHKPYGLLEPLPIPNRPWSSISTDFIGELPQSNGYNAISVWVCRLTKMAHFVPCRTSTTASDLARIFKDNIFRLHGLPEDIVSDRGPQFVSRFWKALCESLSIAPKLSTAFHPQTDGQTERTNQTLEQFLRNYLVYEQSNWAELLPLAEFAYNNSSSKSTKVTPFFANLGHHPRANSLPARRMESSPFEAEKWTSKIQETLKQLTAELKTAQKFQKKFADRHRLPMEFKVGDSVWLVSKNITTTRPSKKLDFKKIGPFKVIKRVGNNAYRLDLPSTMAIHDVFHVALLEPTTSSQIPGRKIEPPPPVTVENTSEFVVEGILDSRLYRRQGQYLVQWEGYHPSEATWEPVSHVANCPDIIAQFHANQPLKPGPWRTGRRTN